MVRRKFPAVVSGNSDVAVQGLRSLTLSGYSENCQIAQNRDARESETAVMHRIEIDDDVYAELERHVKGFEQPNDVLRRLLLKDKARAVKVDVTAGKRGKLLPLIESGFIKTGDKLKHEQTRKGNVFEAEVTDMGWITTGKGVYQAPSPALVDLVGSQIDGWANWTHAASGKSLRSLRYELEQQNGSGS